MSWHSRLLLLLLSACIVVSSLPLRLGVFNRFVERESFVIASITRVEVTQLSDRLACYISFFQSEYRMGEFGLAILRTGALLDMVGMPAPTGEAVAFRTLKLVVSCTCYNNNRLVYKLTID